MIKGETLAGTIPQELITACLAVGNDLVFLPDFKAGLNGLFIKKVYTEAEISYCNCFADPVLRYASTWAAKESVYKALKQVSNRPPGFKKIEIGRLSAAGRPFVMLPPEYDSYKIALSITHDGDYAWAIACLTASI